MPPRFEVVPPPLEERVHASIAAQARAAARGARHFVALLQSQRDSTLTRTSQLFADEAKLQAFATTALTLLLPTHLPGALFLLALVLRLAYALATRALARKAVRCAGAKRQ